MYYGRGGMYGPPRPMYGPPHHHHYGGMYGPPPPMYGPPPPRYGGRVVYRSGCNVF